MIRTMIDINKEVEFGNNLIKDFDNQVNEIILVTNHDLKSEDMQKCEIHNRDASNNKAVSIDVDSQPNNSFSKLTQEGSIDVSKDVVLVGNNLFKKTNEKSINVKEIINSPVLGAENKIKANFDNQSAEGVTSTNENDDILATSSLSAMEIHRKNVNVEVALQNIDAAIDSWNQLQPTVIYSDQSAEKLSKIIDVEAAVKYFIGKQLGDHSSNSNSSDSSSMWSTLYEFFFPNRLVSSLYPSRDFIFQLASTAFDEKDPICLQSLTTIYKKVIGTQINCPRYGNHWSRLGFQGNDPVTDLRGCGLFGLFQILNLCNSSNLDLCKNIYKLSHHQIQNFPFALVSINISSFVLQALRQSTINKILNKCDKSEDRMLNFFMAVSEFHVAVFWRFCKIWKEQGKTMADSGFVLDDLKQYTLKKPQKIIFDFSKSPHSFTG